MARNNTNQRCNENVLEFRKIGDCKNISGNGLVYGGQDYPAAPQKVHIERQFPLTGLSQKNPKINANPKFQEITKLQRQSLLEQRIRLEQLARQQQQLFQQEQQLLCDRQYRQQEMLKRQLQDQQLLERQQLQCQQQQRKQQQLLKRRQLHQHQQPQQHLNPELTLQQQTPQQLQQRMEQFGPQSNISIFKPSPFGLSLNYTQSFWPGYNMMAPIDPTKPFDL